MTISKICFIAPSAYGYFNPSCNQIAGGAERQLYLLSKELTRYFDVHFVVGDYGQPKTERREGVVLQRSYAPGSSRPRIKEGTAFVQHMAAFRRANADLYVTRGIQSGRAPIDYLITKLLGKQWVFNIVNRPRAQRGATGPILSRLFAYGVADARAIVSQTEFHGESFSETFGVDATVVPNGYPEAESIRPYDDRKFFLWVGRLNESQKRPHLFLDLAARLPDQQFVLIGSFDSDPSYANRIERHVADLDNVEFLEGVNPDEIHEYYNRAIALLNTSKTEGFPNTFLEAWRYGTPVLSLDVDLRRFLDCDVGFSEGDFDDLVAAADKLGSHTEHRATIGNRMLEYFQGNYTIEDVANQYRAVLVDESG